MVILLCFYVSTLVSLYYRTAGWIFMKLGKDEVLMAPHLWFGFTARSAQVWIQGGIKIGHGGAPSQKDLLFRLDDWKTKATNRLYSNDLKSLNEEVLLFLVPFRSQIFDMF